MVGSEYTVNTFSISPRPLFDVLFFLTRVYLDRRNVEENTGDTPSRGEGGWEGIMIDGGTM